MNKHSLIKIILIIATILIITVPRVEAQVTYNTSITADTNGYDTYVYVQIPTANITEIDNLGVNITYQSVGLGTVFLASDGETYNIITNSTVNLTPYEKVIIVNDTIYFNADFDGHGILYRKGAGLGLNEWAFAVNASDITVSNIKWDAGLNAGGVNEFVVIGNRSILENCEIFNGSRYGFGFHGSTNSTIRKNISWRAQYGLSGSGAWNYGCEMYNNIVYVSSRNAIKCKGMNGAIIYDNILYVDQGDTDGATKIGIELSTDSPGNTGLRIENNTIILTNKSQAAAGWGINYNYHAVFNNTNINSTGNVFVNLDLGIHCDALSVGFTSLNDTFIDVTTPIQDLAANTFTGSIVTDEPYYTDFPYFAGVYGNATSVYTASGGLNTSEGIYYGLYPSVYTKYTIDASWLGDFQGLYIYIGGVRISLQTWNFVNTRMFGTTSAGTVFTWTDGANVSRAFFTVEADPMRGGAWITWPGDDEGVNGSWLPFYSDKYTDDNAHRFTPSHFTIDERGVAEATLHSFEQEIYVNDFVSAIGSNKHQGLGFDGVRTPDTLYNGLNDLVNLGFNCTLFMDDGYIGNNTWNTWLINTTFELGQHFNPVDLTSIPNTEFKGNVTDQNNTIASLWGKQPKAYAVLGVGWLVNGSRVQWMDHNMSEVQRANRMVKTTPQSEQLNAAGFNYLDNGTTAGFAVAPLYTHETDITPADAGSIDPALWSIWIDHVNGSEVIVVGYYEWYMVNANQHNLEDDAGFTYGTGPVVPPVPPTPPVDDLGEYFDTITGYVGILGLVPLILAGALIIIAVETGTFNHETMMMIVGVAVGVFMIIIIWGAIVAGY